MMKYRPDNPTFLFATIEFLFEMLHEQYNLVDHLLDCDPVTGYELEAEIRETQKRIREKTDIARQNVAAAIEGREVEELKAWDALSDEALATSQAPVEAEGVGND